MSDKVPDGWKKYKLNEIATIKSGKSNSIDAVADGIYPLFDRSKNVKKSSKYLFDCEAIIVPGEGEDFTPKYYKGKFDLHQRAYAVIPDNQICDGKYCYYAILNGRSHFSSVAVGSTVKSLRLSSFESFDILIPPLPEQRAIASIFPPIEDKIELLRQENETLIKILDTCYNLYFTAKHTKKKRTVPLSDIAEIITGKTAPIEEYNKKEGKTVKIASVRDFDYSKIYITDTKEHITQEAVDKMHYTIAPANTVLFVYEMSPGKVALTDCPMVTKIAIAQLKIKDNTYINPEYLYLYLKHFNYNRFIKTYTIVNSIDKSKIGDIPIVIPDKETIDKFTEQVVPLFTKVKTNNYTIQTLERLRDALLPALMSGKIRVV